LRVAQNWGGDFEMEKARGIELARLAIAKGGHDAASLAYGGYAIAFLGEEFKEGLSVLDRAIALNPNRAIALSNAGWVRCYVGQAVDAIGDFERVIRLSPREITLFRVQAGLAFAHLLLKEFEEAVRWGRRALENNPNYTPSHRALAAALAYLGRIEEAQAVAGWLLALVPDFTPFNEKRLFRKSGKLPLILEGLRLAGLPV
jgi:adenylate cyclase